MWSPPLVSVTCLRSGGWQQRTWATSKNLAVLWAAVGNLTAQCSCRSRRPGVCILDICPSLFALSRQSWSTSRLFDHRSKPPRQKSQQKRSSADFLARATYSIPTGKRQLFPMKYWNIFTPPPKVRMASEQNGRKACSTSCLHRHFVCPLQ